tara:strand:+ start:11982 stop:12374 length:393 start_codon:yes stop_codon:yes gene_type:complete
MVLFLDVLSEFSGQQRVRILMKIVMLTQATFAGLNVRRIDELITFANRPDFTQPPTNQNFISVSMRDRALPLLSAPVNNRAQQLNICNHGEGKLFLLQFRWSRHACVPRASAAPLLPAMRLRFLRNATRP